MSVRSNMKATQDHHRYGFRDVPTSGFSLVGSVGHQAGCIEGVCGEMAGIQDCLVHILYLGRLEDRCLVGLVRSDK